MAIPRTTLRSGWRRGRTSPVLAVTGATSAECCLALGARAASIVPVQVSIQPGMQWARMDAQALDTAFVGEFEDMLATVDFK
jgi:hypothetical protein